MSNAGAMAVSAGWMIVDWRKALLNVKPPIHSERPLSILQASFSRAYFSGKINVAKQSTTAKQQKKKDSANVASFEDEEDDRAILDMEEWLQNKPSGFGIGKVYDTSLEDNLLVEIEQEKKAEGGPSKAKVELNNKAVQKRINKVDLHEYLPHGVRILVSNLPKKKNIRRDLKAAFKGVRGLLDIQPNELGDRNTRVPVCKGSAILLFESQSEANSFIARFNEEKVVFGKVQRQLRFEIQKGEPLINVEKQASGPRLLRRNDIVSDISLDGVEVDTENAKADDVSLEDVVAEDTGTQSIGNLDVLDSDLGGLETTSDVLAEFVITENANHDKQDLADRACISEMDEDLDSNGGNAYIYEMDGGLDSSDDDMDEDSEDGDIEHALEIEISVDGVGTVHNQINLAKEHEVEVSVEVAKASGNDENRYYDLDLRIKNLEVQLRQKQARSRRSELDAEILRLKEEKIGILEKRVLSKVKAAGKNRRTKKNEIQEVEPQLDNPPLRSSDNYSEVVEKYFTHS